MGCDGMGETAGDGGCNENTATVLTASSFQYIIRLLNTNVEGKQKVMYALTKITGVGRRYSNLVCKKADVDLGKRAGDLTSEELERLVTIIQNPLQCRSHAS
jgi:small subunit ribosomal protein S18e